MVVAADPWQKRDVVVASAEDRFAMVEAAVDGIDGVIASDLEIRRGGPTYSVDTAEELTAPDRELFLIVGADVVPNLPTWDRIDVLRKLCRLVVINRAAAEAALPDGWAAERVVVPAYDDSSTEARRRLAARMSVDDLLAPAVVQVIEDRGLYTFAR